MAHYASILFNTQVEKKKDTKKPAELKRLPPLGKGGDRDSEEPSDEGGQRKRTEAEEREAFRRLKENRRRHNAGQRATR